MRTLRAIAIALAALQPLAAAAQPIENGRTWQDEVVYVVILQKFFNGDPRNDVMARRYVGEEARLDGGFWGGDLEGDIQKLDDLKSLGVTTLLLYPVIANDERPFGKYLATGYRPRDYFHVDENFGDLATLKMLVTRAHDRDMRVILDLPLGMPGLEHPFYKDPAKHDWFGNESPYGVRQWNADKPEVADYLIEVSRFWKKQSECDGFRLDSAQMHAPKFWKRYVQEIKGDSGDRFLLLAELPIHPRKIGEFLTETRLDGAYDFSFGITRDVLGTGEKPVGALAFVLKEAKEFYPSPRSMAAQIDNYEDPEFVTVSHAPKERRMAMAMTLLLTIDRVPFLYSGDEAALSYRDVGALFAEPHQNAAFTQQIRTLIALRRNEAALRRGEFRELDAKAPLFAFLRTLGDDRVLVILNTSDRAQQFRVPVGAIDWRDCALFDLVHRRSGKPRGDADPIEIEPFGARVLRIEK